MPDPAPVVAVREATPHDAGAIVRILNAIIAARVYTVFDTPIGTAESHAKIDGRYIEAIMIERRLDRGARGLTR